MRRRTAHPIELLFLRELVFRLLPRSAQSEQAAGAFKPPDHRKGCPKKRVGYCATLVECDRGAQYTVRKFEKNDGNPAADFADGNTKILGRDRMHGSPFRVHDRPADLASRRKGNDIARARRIQSPRRGFAWYVCWRFTWRDLPRVQNKREAELRDVVHETRALAHDAHRAPDHGSEHAGAMPIGIFQCGNFDGVGHCLPPIITSMRLLRGARCSERLDAHATLPVTEDDNFKLVVLRCPLL